MSAFDRIGARVFILLMWVVEASVIYRMVIGDTMSTPVTILFIGLLVIGTCDIAADRIAAAIREAKRDD
jgi:hypothetical protein